MQGDFPFSLFTSCHRHFIKLLTRGGSVFQFYLKGVLYFTGRKICLHFTYQWCKMRRAMLTAINNHHRHLPNLSNTIKVFFLCIAQSNAETRRGSLQSTHTQVFGLLLCGGGLPSPRTLEPSALGQMEGVCISSAHDP